MEINKEEILKKYKLSDEEHNQYYQTIKRIYTGGKIPVDNPIAVIIGGQTGAGKSGIIGYSTKMFMDENVIIINSDEIKPFHPQSEEIAKLYPKFQELLQMGLALGSGIEENEDKILAYINKCLELKCRLIEIHPFRDGNGRTMRALTNLLFKLANIPPIYVKLSERNNYLKAMSSALEEQDYSKIREFYYYKICDSILELDVNKKINKESALKKIKLK